MARGDRRPAVSQRTDWSGRGQRSPQIISVDRRPRPVTVFVGSKPVLQCPNSLGGGTLVGWSPIDGASGGRDPEYRGLDGGPPSLALLHQRLSNALGVQPALPKGMEYQPALLHLGDAPAPGMWA